MKNIKIRLYYNVVLVFEGLSFLSAPSGSRASQVQALSVEVSITPVYGRLS